MVSAFSYNDAKSGFFYCILSILHEIFHQKAILLIALLCLLRPLEAQSIHEEFFHIEAEEIIYDPKSLTITARGKVHISQYIPNQQGWRHLYAHEIIYQQKLYFLSNRMSKGYVISKEKLWLKEPMEIFGK